MRSLEVNFFQYLTCELEMDPLEIKASSADELLDHVLTYEGYGMFAGERIRRRVMQIYGIDLEEISRIKAWRECQEM